MVSTARISGDGDERLLAVLEQAEEFLHDVGCGDGAIAMHEAITRLSPRTRRGTPPGPGAEPKRKER